MIRRSQSTSPEQTFELGRAFGRAAHAGLVIGLDGGLGAGKTLFTHGLFAGMGLGEEDWSGSPTFVLASRYRGSPGLVHADFYRLGTSAEVGDLALDDGRHEGCVVVVEWSERFPEQLPPDRLTIRFTVLDEARRELTLEAAGALAEQVLGEVFPAPPSEARISPLGGTWP